MSRDEQILYEQDELGNERRKLDRLRAQEGMTGNTGDDTGLTSIGTAETGDDILLMSKPSHASQMILNVIQAYNSQSSDTFRLKEATLNGNNSITSTTRKTVPINVDSESTIIGQYKGATFDKAIAVESQFAGEIGVGIISDHKETSEPSVSE